MSARLPIIRVLSGAMLLLFSAQAWAQSSSCTPPDRFMQASALEGNAGLTWRETGQSQSWIIAWGNRGVLPNDMPNQITVSRESAIVNVPVSGTMEAYVKSNCGAQGSSWVGPVRLFPLNDCSSLMGFGVLRDTVCGPSKASFQLPQNSQGIWWLGSDPVHYGPTFESSTLRSDQTYWVSEAQENGDEQPFGPRFNNQIGGFANFASGQIISVFDTLLLDSAVLSADGPLRFIVEIWNPNKTALLYASDTLRFDQAGTFPFSLDIPLIPGAYFMGVNVLPGGGRLFRSTIPQDYPMRMPGLMRIDSASNGLSNRYYYLYDLRIKPLCTSAPSMAHAHVGQQGIAGMDEVDTLCIRDSLVYLNDLIEGQVSANGYWLRGNDTLSYVDLKVAADGEKMELLFITPGTFGCSDTAEYDIHFIECKIGAFEYAESSVEVFPNPASDFFEIRFSKETSYNLTVFNTSGKEVMHTMSNSSHRYSTANLRPGVYYLEVSFETDRSVLKMIIR